MKGRKGKRDVISPVEVAEVNIVTARSEMKKKVLVLVTSFLQRGTTTMAEGNRNSTTLLAMSDVVNAKKKGIKK